MKTKEVTGELDALEGHQLLKHEGKFACGSCEITNPLGDGKRQRHHTMPKCIELILSTQGTI